MTYREIANEINYTGYASTIAQANGGDEATIVKQGNRVIIPNFYFEVGDTAWNGAMPSVDRIIGSLYAVASNPQVSLKPKKEHINWVEKFVEVAACVAVMVLAPELFAVMMGATLGAATASLTAATTAQAMIAYGAAGAVSSAVGQSIAIGFGTQHGFDMKNMAASALTAAVSAGVVKGMQSNYAVSNTSKISGSFTGKAMNYVVRAEASAVAQQAALVATRLQSRPDWKSTQTAAFNGLINAGADTVFGDNTSPDGLKAPNLAASDASTSNKVMSAGVNALGSSLVNAAVYHQPLRGESLLASTAGAMVGTYVGDKSLDALLANQRAHVQTQRARSTQSGHAFNRRPTSQRTGQQRLDAVKEAKQTRANRWSNSSAGSWQDKYMAESGDVLSWESHLDSQLTAPGVNHKPELFHDMLVANRMIREGISSHYAGLYQSLGHGTMTERLKAGVELVLDAAMLIPAAKGVVTELRAFRVRGGASFFMPSRVTAAAEVVGEVGAESLAVLPEKTVRFAQLASGSKAEVRALLKSGELELPQEQTRKLLATLGGGRMDKVTIKLMQDGEVRLLAERSGAVDGYQRMSYGIDTSGNYSKIVQTAFDDANTLVHQRPGISKNNLYDVKVWKNKI